MKQDTLPWLLLAFLTLAACNFKTNPEFQLGQSFMLKNGQTAQWQEDAQVQIRFDSLTEDSRCPQGIQCIWAGRAIMAITFMQNGKSQSSALVMGDPAGTNYSDKAVFGEFNVQLLQIKPHPVANQTIPHEQYVMEIDVRKGE